MIEIEKIKILKIKTNSDIVKNDDDIVKQIKKMNSYSMKTVRGTCLPAPNTKLVEEKFEFWCQKVDFGVFEIADFKFDGLESKFERNWRKRFSNFRNRILGPKIENRNRISGFDVPILYFSGNFNFPNFEKIEI